MRRPAGPAPAAPAQQPVAAEKESLEKKLSDLEKQLTAEREKVLLASLKSQEEAANAAKVESSLKDLQDKLRRERRDQEQEENRLKLESRIRDLEGRLAQERETWVSTLKNQMAGRETQDREIETHFTQKIQEMERRWLEEKAHWQKAVSGKEEEIRNLRALAEKLKGIDGELSRAQMERKGLEARVAELSQEKAEYAARVQTVIEKEKEIIKLQAEATLSRQQQAMLQERFEREAQALRMSAKEREERLLIEQDRLNREINTLAERMRRESEAEVKRVRQEAQAEIQRHQEGAAQAQAEFQRMRAVSGALEKQLASVHVQLEQHQKAAAQWERVQERYKAEFLVLQRKWAEREKEIRAELGAHAKRLLDSEMARVKMGLQEEFKDRAGEIEARTRDEASGRIKALAEEAAGLRARLNELGERAAKDEEGRRILSQERLGAESALNAAREELGALKAANAEAHAALERERQARAEAERLKIENERLAMAQAAEIRQLQDSFLEMRAQFAKDAQVSRIHLQEKIELEKQVEELKKKGNAP